MKRVLLLLLIICCLSFLVACGNDGTKLVGDTQGTEGTERTELPFTEGINGIDGNPGTGERTEEGNPVTDENNNTDVSLVDPKDWKMDESTPVHTQFRQVMERISQYGDRAAKLTLDAQSDYYYSLSGAGISSMRYAVEYILWLKGEGEDLTSFTADSLYTGWDTIAGINYASPYPYYFEGLIYHIQGKTEEAVDCYANASIMPLFPEEGLDFFYFKDLKIEELYSLRDELRTQEEALYVSFHPGNSGIPRDYRNYDCSYLCSLAREACDTEDYRMAYLYSKSALKNDAFNAVNYITAAACGIGAEDYITAADYVDEGLLIAPDDEGLKQLSEAIIGLGGTLQK